MSPWQETAIAICLSLGAFGVAFHIRALRGVWFVCGLAAVASAWAFANHLTRQSNAFMLATGVPMFTGALFRLPLTPIVRIGMAFAAAIVTVWAGWLDVLSPALCRSELSRVETIINRDGVCLQQTSYTCGPASAVTLLRRLGIDASESEIALAAKSSSRAGTAPDELAEAVRICFGPGGINAVSKHLGSLDELRQVTPLLTVIRFNRGLDHWITVLGITGTNVRYADPVFGICEVSREDFSQRWEGEAVEIWRESGLHVAR